MSRWYKSRKKDYDSKVYAYLVKRLREPFNKSDAYFMGNIDDMGNDLGQKPSDWAYTNLDKLLVQLKLAMGKERLNSLDNTYDNVDSLSIINGVDDVNKYNQAFAKVIGLVEETTYLPAEQRGKGDFIEQEEEKGLSMTERLQRALTCATYLLFSIKNNGVLVKEKDFNDLVLPAVEATFNVRSIGSVTEIASYLKEGGCVDYANVTNEGYLLAVRIAKALEKSGMLNNPNENVDNVCRSWRSLAHAG